MTWLAGVDFKRAIVRGKNLQLSDHSKRRFVSAPKGKNGLICEQSLGELGNYPDDTDQENRTPEIHARHAQMIRRPDNIYRPETLAPVEFWLGNGHNPTKSITLANLFGMEVPWGAK